MQLPLGVQVATAGFVLGRLLLNLPPAALVQNLDDQAMRATWPLSDPHSRRALSLIRDGVGELGAVRFDYERLFLRTPAIDLHTAAGDADVIAELREIYRRDNLSVAGSVNIYDDHIALQILYLADRAAEAAQADLAGDRERARRACAFAVWLRENHLDPAVRPILAATRERAATPLFKALPALVQGFLDEHRRVCDELAG